MKEMRELALVVLSPYIETFITSASPSVTVILSILDGVSFVGAFAGLLSVMFGALFPPPTLTVTVLLLVANAENPSVSVHCTFHVYAPLAKEIVILEFDPETIDVVETFDAKEPDAL